VIVTVGNVEESETALSPSFGGAMSSASFPALSGVPILGWFVVLLVRWVVIPLGTVFFLAVFGVSAFKELISGLFGNQVLEDIGWWVLLFIVAVGVAWWATS